MPRRTDYEDDWADEYEPDGDGEYVPEDEDDEPTVPCPYCRKQILEDTPRCPYCENYISEEDARPARKPWWILVGVVAGLYVVYRWIVG